MKYTGLLLLSLCTWLPLAANFQLKTNAVTISASTPFVRAGSVSVIVTSDLISEPQLLRFTLDDDLLLATNLVDPALDQPINLPIRLLARRHDERVIAPANSVQLVRWLAGEASFWVRINEPTAHWLASQGHGMAPSIEAPVSFSIGLSAREDDARHAGPAEGLYPNANLPFASRSAIITGKEDAVSSLLTLDTRQWDGAVGQPVGLTLSSEDGLFPTQTATIGIMAKGEDCSFSAVNPSGPALASLCINSGGSEFLDISADRNLDVTCTTSFTVGSYLRATTAMGATYGFTVNVDGNGDPIMLSPDTVSISSSSGVYGDGSWSQPYAPLAEIFQDNGRWLSPVIEFQLENSGLTTAFP